MGYVLYIEETGSAISDLNRTAKMATRSTGKTCREAWAAAVCLMWMGWSAGVEDDAPSFAFGADWAGWATAPLTIELDIVTGSTRGMVCLT